MVCLSSAYDDWFLGIIGQDLPTVFERRIIGQVGTRDRRAILRICYGSVAMGVYKSHEFCIRDCNAIQMDFENRNKNKNATKRPTATKIN